MNTLPEVTSKTSFRKPADYYTSPIDESARVFPRWVPFGCGSASIVLLIVLALVAVGVSKGAFGQLFEYVFAQMQGELDKMMTPDVTPPQKAGLDREMKTMRDAIRTNKLKIDRLQPLMRDIRDISADERVTSAEVQRLTRELQALNQPPAPPRPAAAH